MNQPTRAWLSQYRLIRSTTAPDDAPESTHIWLPHEESARLADAQTLGEREHMLCGATIPVDEQREMTLDDVDLPEQCMRCVKVLLRLSNAAPAIEEAK